MGLILSSLWFILLIKDIEASLVKKITIAVGFLRSEGSEHGQHRPDVSDGGRERCQRGDIYHCLGAGEASTAPLKVTNAHNWNAWPRRQLAVSCSTHSR